MRAIDVIVPVYRGVEETRDCIESVLTSLNSVCFELIVINDASPDRILVEYLRDMSSQGRITLLENPDNLGFVDTVNRGMALNPDRDVVLLNSDAKVANDWLDRLAVCAYSDEQIGTVTPFSNNATICSYPRFCEDNFLPDGWGLSGLDALFREINRRAVVDIPTAVGFCMYIRRDCIAEVGLFDVERFGKGYGEENDFCMRARSRGWRNVLCGDTFVFHAGGVSFADMQNPRKTRAMETMRSLHPNYERLVYSHITEDPARPLRLFVDAARILNGQRPVLLFLTHNRGGGTERHVKELAMVISGDAEVLVVRPSEDGQTELTWLRGREGWRLFFDLPGDYSVLLRALKCLGVQRIHFHHTLALNPVLWGLSTDLGVPYDFTIHDYYSVCPQISLSTLQGQYCGEPDERECNRCLAISPAPGGADIRTWRNNYSELLAGAARVFAPSHDVAQRIRRYVPAAKTVVTPHPERLPHGAYPTPQPVVLNGDAPLRIAVIGALSKIKGAEVLEACAMQAKKEGYPLEFHLLGYGYRNLITIPESNLHVHGSYDDEELPTKLSALHPHLVWFPAQWPETYSYTLSASLEGGLPVVVPDLGAFPERISGRSWSWIMPWNAGASQLNHFFLDIRNKHFLTGEGPSRVRLDSFKDHFQYQTDYLAPVSRVRIPVSEYSGVPSELREIICECAYPRLGKRQKLVAKIKSSILQCFVAWRASSFLRPIVRFIPSAWQRNVKSWLQGHLR